MLERVVPSINLSYIQLLSILNQIIKDYSPVNYKSLTKWRCVSKFA